MLKKKADTEDTQLCILCVCLFLIHIILVLAISTQLFFNLDSNGTRWPKGPSCIVLGRTSLATYNLGTIQSIGPTPKKLDKKVRHTSLCYFSEEHGTCSLKC